MPLALGDRLVVDADGKRKALVLPTVDVDVVDQGGDRVTGRTLPGAPLQIDVHDLTLPGMRIEAMELLPSGHRIGRQRYIPQLDL